MRIFMEMRYYAYDSSWLLWSDTIIKNSSLVLTYNEQKKSWRKSQKEQFQKNQQNQSNLIKN